MQTVMVSSNFPGGLRLSDEAEALVGKLDAVISKVVGDHNDANFRFTTIPQVYYSARVKSEPELESAILKSVPIELIENLFETVSPKTPWLSGNYSINPRTGRRCFFNYQDRFNRYQDGWRYNSSSRRVSPKRTALIRFFDKYPRENEPKWLSGLRCEERELQEFIKTASAEEIYGEALSQPELEAGPLVTEVWSVISEIYEKKLREEDELRRWFVDSELSSKQEKALRTLVEIPVLNEALAEALESWTEEELLPLGRQPVIVENGFTELQEFPLEDFDEMLEEVFSELVKLQSKKRFPDLGF